MRGDAALRGQQQPRVSQPEDLNNIRPLITLCICKRVRAYVCVWGCGCACVWVCECRPTCAFAFVLVTVCVNFWCVQVCVLAYIRGALYSLRGRIVGQMAIRYSAE